MILVFPLDVTGMLSVRIPPSQVIQSFVRQAMGYLDATPDEATRVQLITTLQSVTEGKIFVEIERARLTRKLAAIKEARGEISEAADVLQAVAVETFGAMAKTEKIAFILEQARCVQGSCVDASRVFGLRSMCHVQLTCYDARDCKCLLNARAHHAVKSGLYRCAPLHLGNRCTRYR